MVAVNLPVKSGKGEKAGWKGGEVDRIDVIKDLNTIFGFEDVSTVVAKQGAVNLNEAAAYTRNQFYVIVNVFLENGVGIDEIGLVVLLENFDSV